MGPPQGIKKRRSKAKMPKKQKKSQNPKKQKKQSVSALRKSLRKLRVEEASYEVANSVRAPNPSVLFKAWTDPKGKSTSLLNPQLDTNIKCTDKGSGKIHYKLIGDQFAVIKCHFENQNIDDNTMILLSSTLRVRILDIYRNLKLKASSNLPSASLIGSKDRATVLLQVFLDRNQITSYGLIPLLNVLSLPIVFVECLSLSRNPLNEDAAKLISNFIANCKTIPHRLCLANSIDVEKLYLIIRGMTKRRNVLSSNDSSKDIILGMMELEERLLAMKEIKTPIECGEAVSDGVKSQLLVPMTITVDKWIDAENVATKLIKDLFVCGGADYQYMGHGQCSVNHCGVTSSMFDQKYHSAQQIGVNLQDLPLIHLFIDDAAKKSKEKDTATPKILKKAKVKTADDVMDRGYLALMFDGKALEYLLTQRWDMHGTLVMINGQSGEPPPNLMVSRVHDLLYFMRPNFPSTQSKCISWIGKVYGTTSLTVNKGKLKCLGIAVTEYHQRLKLTISAVSKSKMEIKKFMTQNKGTPFTVDNWKKVLKSKLNINKNVRELAEWAADVVQTEWSIQKEFKQILGAKEWNEWLKNPVGSSDGDTEESFLDHLISTGESHSFSVKRGMVVIGIEEAVLAKCKYRDTHRKVLAKGFEAEVLKVVDISTMKSRDVISVTYSKSVSGNSSICASKIHRRLRGSTSRTKWQRDFFSKI